MRRGQLLNVHKYWGPFEPNRRYINLKRFLRFHMKRYRSSLSDSLTGSVADTPVRLGQCQLTGQSRDDLFRPLWVRLCHKLIEFQSHTFLGTKLVLPNGYVQDLVSVRSQFKKPTKKKLYWKNYQRPIFKKTSVWKCVYNFQQSSANL